ncbi:MAG: MFS transporter [Deltaproteobacteria bacterium]|nr:MFS transporter [Deltaproteobacteria bacterium]
MLGRVTCFFVSLKDYNRSFWAANVSELFERVAFYGMTPMLVVYLTEARHIPDATAIRISGNFGMVTYGLAALSGFLADLLGYRRAILLAYALLSVGYLATGQATSYGGILAALLLVAVGASLIKPIITGTVQKSCSDAQRAVGFSVYYTLVNVGGSIGPNLSAAVRGRFGVESVFVSSAAAAAVALLLVLLVYREPAGPEAGDKRTLGQFGGDFLRVITNPRLMLLFLFVACFWSMFFAFMNVLPLYLRDDLHVSPALLGLIPSLESIAVICLQVIVGYLVRGMAPFRAILLAILVSAAGVAFMGVYPLALFAGLGVMIFALGEMIYSAHFYHYLGNMAPKGQTGMYMGFAFLPIAMGSFISGQIGGPIASYFRVTLQAPQMMWFGFAAVGLAAGIGLAVLTRTSTPSDRVA